MLKKLILSGNSKSCNLDPIPTKLLKEHLDLLLYTVYNIINGSLQSGVFPTSLKTASVTPLLKKQSLDKEIKKNFRPVSNLPYLGKLIEKAALQQLSAYKESNDLYEWLQSAYRKNHSTETALVKIMNDVLNAIDSRKCVMLILLDMSACFDTIDHQILLQRLEDNFRVSGTALEWMRSYLSDRSQYVTIEGARSHSQPLTVGLPQGSLIGPSEYPTYSSPLFDIARKHDIDIHMYADDTQLYCSFKPEDFSEAVHKMEMCLEEMRNWMVRNCLKLNDEKTEFLVIGAPLYVSRIQEPCTIKIGNTNITATETAKNIGAIFDTHLTLIPHVNNIAKSCYAQLRMLGQIRYNLTEDAAVSLVHAYITSRLDNGNALLFGLSEKHVHKLQLIQNTAARIVSRASRYDRITPILKRLHWLPIKFRIDYKICLLTFKCIQHQAPKYLQDLLHRHIPSRHLRSSDQNLLERKYPNLETYGGRAFSAVSQRLWNGLPKELRTCDDLEEFKKLLKTHMFLKAFGS